MIDVFTDGQFVTIPRNLNWVVSW